VDVDPVVAAPDIGIFAPDGWGRSAKTHGFSLQT